MRVIPSAFQIAQNHARVRCVQMVYTVTSSYPNPPMLEAAVPSPNTLPVEEPIGLLKAGV